VLEDRLWLPLGQHYEQIAKKTLIFIDFVLQFAHFFDN